MALSNAINANQVSAVIGYEVQAGFGDATPGSLPQRIAVLSEVPSGVTDLDPFEFTNAAVVGQKYGYGTPPHIIARILRRSSGDALGSIPTLILPVEQAAGAAATTWDITVSGTATANSTQFVVVGGRSQLDGYVYSFAVNVNDDAETVAAAIVDSINSVLGSPVTAAINGVDPAIVDITSKWGGLSSADLSISIDSGDQPIITPIGVDYVISKSDGSGIPSIGDALANLGSEWTTILVNGVGSDSTILDALEAFNGNINDKTGRYDPTVFKPFIALFGNVDSDRNSILAITDIRANEMTNVLCPAPNSLGLPMEAAANVAVILAPLSENDPSIDAIQSNYPDMPIPEDRNIGDFTSPTDRDLIVKVGSSTVELNNANYRIVDLVTTYHPDDEPVGLVTYRWVRDLFGIDWNVAFQYLILVQLYNYGKTIIEDGISTTSRNTISRSNWKSIVNNFSDSLVAQALTADSDFMKESIKVDISVSNPNRFETFFEYKRTGVARVVPTTAQSNPNVGQLTI